VIRKKLKCVCLWQDKGQKNREQVKKLAKVFRQWGIRIYGQFIEILEFIFFTWTEKMKSNSFCLFVVGSKIKKTERWVQL
jgi:hypothetical protein